MDIQFFNTLTRAKEDFVPLEEGKVNMYTCGPTVYDYVHIGNLRSFTFADTLRRTLIYFGYEVKQVMNITDIGHLSSDADSGEDKMTKGLLREGKELTLANMRELAEFYTEKFKENLRAMNIMLPDGLYFASDYVKEDIELVQKLEERGFTYKTSDGIYFDTSKFENYGALWGGKRIWNQDDARVDVNKEKRQPEDFALWKFNSEIGFESPWGKGFPGWHIECSAMGIKFLGEQFDIHTGGIDLSTTHHTNEIAQSECATGKSPFVKYWMHNEFVDLSGDKMAKSSGNFLTLNSLIEKDMNPVAYRLWLLMANYRTKVNFNWEALEGANTALERLYRLYEALGDAEGGNIEEEHKTKFMSYLGDDLDTPRALTVLWDVLKDEYLSNEVKKATVLDFDKVLGLGFANLRKTEVPREVEKLAEEREEARRNKDWAKSDELRDKIKDLGYEINDNASGYNITKV